MRANQRISIQELLRNMREDERQLHHLVAQLSRLETKVYGLHASYGENLTLLDQMTGIACFTPATPSGSPLLPPDPLLQKAALHGVASVRIEPTSKNGRGLITIDAEPPFLLSQTLTQFLDVLIGAKPSADGLPCWQTKREIATQLEMRLHRRYTDQAIRNLVYRLKEALYIRGKINPFVIMTSSAGIRFALRRRTNENPDA